MIQMQISGDTLYELLRYAHKNGIFYYHSDDRHQREVAKCFLELRDKRHPLRRSAKLKYELKPSKLGEF